MNIFRVLFIGLAIVFLGLSMYIYSEFKSLLNTLDSRGDGENIGVSNVWQQQESLDNSFTWIGHATIYLNLDGVNVLFDPIFSERSSPVSFIGPKRIIPPAIDIKNLPKIDKVFISHNHYDHLDIPSLRQLQERNEKIIFYVPMGDQKLLLRKGLTNVRELNWWDEVIDKNLQIVFFPVKHWSARGFFDKKASLWGGWYLKSNNYTVAHFGDTAYDDRFIKFPEFMQNLDLAFIPIGSYAPREVEMEHHVNPEEAVKIYNDLNIQYAYGIHWGTFFLSKEDLYEPPDLIKDLTSEDVIFSTSQPGIPFYLNNLNQVSIPIK